MKRPSSEEWRIAVGPWSMVDGCCVVNLCSWVVIATHWTVTNWSSLEDVCGLLDDSKFEQTSTLWTISKWFEVPNPYCIIWYFTSVINSNNRALAGKSQMGAEILTSDLRDHRRAGYQLSYASSLCEGLFNTVKNLFTSPRFFLSFFSRYRCVFPGMDWPKYVLH
jgi:hypothetical protein